MAKRWTSEVVLLCWEDNDKVAIEYQNGRIECYMLKVATKQDRANLLMVDDPNQVKPAVIAEKK